MKKKVTSAKTPIIAPQVLAIPFIQMAISPYQMTGGPSDKNTDTGKHVIKKQLADSQVQEKHETPTI